MSAAADAGRDHGHDQAQDDAAAGGAGMRVPAPAPVPSLKAAMRTARVEDAERSRAVADLNGAELARLELLKDSLQPVLAQIPSGVDLFDAAVMPGTHPRLFIDMIGFVEMAHDKREYRFVQDTLHGRVILCESERIDTLREAVTAYIARRLIERDRALVSSYGPTPAAAGAAPPTAVAKRKGTPGRWRRAGRIVLEYIGIAALVTLLWVLGHALYQWEFLARH